jgi:prolyl 4-hydroxylase
MYAIKDFLTSEECEFVIEEKRLRLKKSEVVAPDAKKATEFRTSETAYFSKKDGNFISDKVTILLNIPEDRQEHVQIARYLPGQFYKAHYDSFDEETETGKECIGRAGQRVATVLVYLNQPSQGGATNFPHAGIRVKPKKGVALVFFPCTINGEMDPLTLHSAEDAGDEKWVSQIWCRQYSFNKDFFDQIITYTTQKVNEENETK